MNKIEAKRFDLFIAIEFLKPARITWSELQNSVNLLFIITTLSSQLQSGAKTDNILNNILHHIFPHHIFHCWKQKATSKRDQHQ